MRPRRPAPLQQDPAGGERSEAVLAPRESTTMQVVLLLGDPVEEQRLGDALIDRAQLVAFSTVGEAHAALAALRTTVVVVCLHDTQAAHAIGAIREIRAAFPRLAVVAYLDIHTVQRQLLVQAIHAGASDLMLRGIDDGSAVAQHVLAHAHVMSLSDAWLAELAPDLSVPLFPIVSYGLRTPAAADSLSSTAAALGLARRTLSQRLAALGAPPPRKLFTWTRLLLAASLLAERGRSLRSVSRQLHFRSSDALRQLLQRYAQVSVGVGANRTHVRPAVKQAFLTALRESTRGTHRGDDSSSAK